MGIHFTQLVADYCAVWGGRPRPLKGVRIGHQFPECLRGFWLLTATFTTGSGHGIATLLLVVAAISRRTGWSVRACTPLPSGRHPAAALNAGENLGKRWATR